MMRLSFRTFLLDQSDTLYRLSNSKFEQMLRDPKSHPVHRFAASRVRMSEVAISMVNQQPDRVVWSTFDMLIFNDKGHLDAMAFNRHQRACAELGLAPPIAGSRNDKTVVDAAIRFVVNGGCWVPSPFLLRQIGAAALGQIKCRRL
jgi:hypothetical protein